MTQNQSLTSVVPVPVVSVVCDILRRWLRATHVYYDPDKRDFFYQPCPFGDFRPVTDATLQAANELWPLPITDPDFLSGGSD